MIYEESFTPETLASRLAEYISDPSTIRARVKDHFGRAPSLEECREFRRKHENKKQKHVITAPEKFTFFCQRHDGPYETCADGYDRCMTCAKERREKELKRELDHIRNLQEQKRLREKAANKIAGEVVANALEKLKEHEGQFHELVIKRVAKIFGISVRHLINGNRERIYVDARSVVTKVLRHHGWSFPQIAKLFPRPHNAEKYMDHTSLVHLNQTWDIRAKRNPLVAKATEALTK